MDEKKYQIYEIPSDFSLTISEEGVFSELSASVEALVDVIWNEAQKLYEGLLFNGKIFVFKSFVNGKLTGCFIDYKYYRAQSALPELQSVLNIKPIAISGSCIYREEILIGRRSMSVTGYPGHYELVPSGGISLDAFNDGKLDLRKQAMLELEEEAGVYSDYVESCIPAALINDVNASTYEIYMEINLKDRGDMKSSLEYSELQWIPLFQLLSYVEKENENFVPLSLYLIKQFFNRDV